MSRLQEDGRSARFSLSPYQRDVWVAAMQFPELAQYTLFGYERFSGHIDIAALKQALIQAARQADVFALRIGEDDGALYQWVDTAHTPVVVDVDLTSAADAALGDWLEKTFHTPYPLEGAPLMDLFLVRLPDSAIAYVRGHHAICDAWGLRLFLERVRAEYLRTTGTAKEAAAGEAPNAPADLPRYAAVTKADKYLGSQEHVADQAHFAAALDGVEPALWTRKLPSGARPTGRYSFPIERQLVEQIRDRGDSPFLAISAALALYLMRVHRSDEAVLGVALMNRGDALTRRTIGHFANTLPLRVSATGEATVAQFLDGLKRDTRELLRHQRMPLGELVRKHGQLFDTTISYLQWPSPAPLPGVTYETVAETHAHDPDALAIWVWELGSERDLRVDFEYARDVFDEDFPIEAAARHIEALLRAMIASPDQPLAQLEMLSAEERDELVRRRNATAISYARHTSLSQLLRDQIAATPERTAVIEPDGAARSFRELGACVDAVAAALRAKGVETGDRVAVLVERGPQLMPAIMGAQMAGAAYVPIDTRYPLERIRLLIEDSDAKAILVGDADELWQTVAELAGDRPVLQVSELMAVQARAHQPAPSPSDLAYVIYTSGSTGKPKGAMVEHHSVVNRLGWMQRQYPIGERDVLLQKTPISFDVSVWELFWWSFTGAKLALLPPGAEKNAQELLAAIAQRGVTVLHFVPSMLSPFLDLLESDAQAVQRAATLRLVFCSGEALLPAQVARFRKLFPSAVQLVNLYGPTEATVDVSYFDCTEEAPKRVPIGKPIDNIQLYVLDRAMRPQPMGAPGELYIGGVGVARGYLNRAEMTRERFLPDPFAAASASEPSAQLYKTGDLVRWLGDGNIEYLGRIDDQVKIRGNRVELNEVKNALAGLPGVRDAAVVAPTSAVRGQHLVGYYAAEAEMDVAALRSALAVRLPDFMIPAFFVRIDEVPLTPNGKLDHKRLPSTQASGAAAPPRNHVEAELVAIWAEVLDATTVGIDDDFFALGGDSILMLRVRAKAQKRGLGFEISDLMRHPTIAGLAPRVARPAEQQSFAPLELVSDVDRPSLSGFEDAFPTSRLSLGLLFHTSQHPDSAIYRDVFRYRFALEWDERKLRRAVEAVVRHFPALRSDFDLVGCSEPVQRVHRKISVAPLVADLRDRAEADADAVIDAHIQAHRFTPYALDKAPLYHFAAFATAAGGFQLVFSFHHAILDGFSVANLIAALVSAYRGVGELAPVPTLASFLVEERRAIGSETSARYWSELLRGASMTKLDGFSAHEPKGDHEATRRRFDFPAELSAELKRFAAERAISVKSLLVAAHCLTMHALTGQATVVTGAVTHGRPEIADGDRMVGLFLNTIPVRSDVRVSDDQASPEGWAGFVARVFQQEREGHPHRRYPLAAIQQAHGDILHTAFNYVNLHALEPLAELRDLEVWEETNFPLFVNAIVDPLGDGMYLRVDVDGRTITSAQAKLIGATYLSLLQRICAKPDEPVDFAFLAAPPSYAAPADPLIDVVTRFERMVEQFGERCAVAHDERRWSYRQLDRASRSVAAHLLQLGAKRGDTIGIALRRSPEMIAAIWGILRAGLVCVPLDVSYPAHRLALIIETAQPYRVIADPPNADVTSRDAVLLVEDLLADKDLAPLRKPALDELAMFLFTSGSTGRPKAVELTHRMWANYTQWQLAVPSGLVGGSTLQFAPLSFDMSFQEIFSTQCTGGELRMCSNEERLNPSALLTLLEKYQVQRALLPFIALQQLADASNTLGVRPRSLKVVVSSGEQLRITKEVRAFCAAMPGMLLENQYGPTETHQVTYYSLTGAPESYPDLPPIGRPLDGVEIQLLDGELRPVPAGAIGGIYVGGDCLARGYHHAPELTAERFLDHPQRPGAKLYRTGDIGRLLDNGDIVWLGREDKQVKVRGFRVEPAEVEINVMRQAARFPGLRAAAVVARQRPNSSDAFLCAFLTGDAASVDVEELQKAIAAEVPGFMVPSHFVWLEEFPLTPSGKRDDGALRAIPLAQPKGEEHVPPRDEYETALAQLLGELLNVRRVGIRDNFFTLGGTSITAMRLVLTIEKRYGVAIPIAGLIETPTVEGLATRLRERSAVTVSKWSPLVALRTEGDQPPLFLVHPLGGHVLCYLALTRALPPGRPVYALQAPGSDAGSAPLESIPALAAEYLAAIRAVQPKGPYVLGGWSFGGFVAYEMTRQLHASDGRDSVQQLIVLDSITMRRNHVVDASEDILLQFFYWELVWFERSQTSVEPLPPLPTLEAQLDHIVERAIAAGVIPAGTSRQAIARLYELFRANWKALLDYKPPVTDLEVALVRADGPLPASLKPMHELANSLYEDPTNGWADWTTGQLDVVEVGGDHLLLMKEPWVNEVAAAIVNLLDAPSGN